MRKKKNKDEYIDDGHTVYNMDVDGMPYRRVKPKDDNLNVTKAEKKAIIKAAFAQYTPFIICAIICFIITMIIISFWLK